MLNAFPLTGNKARTPLFIGAFQYAAEVLRDQAFRLIKPSNGFLIF